MRRQEDDRNLLLACLPDHVHLTGVDLHSGQPAAQHLDQEPAGELDQDVGDLSPHLLHDDPRALILSLQFPLELPALHVRPCTYKTMHA